MIGKVDFDCCGVQWDGVDFGYCGVVILDDVDGVGLGDFLCDQVVVGIGQYYDVVMYGFIYRFFEGLLQD